MDLSAKDASIDSVGLGLGRVRTVRGDLAVLNVFVQSPLETKAPSDVRRLLEGYAIDDHRGLLEQEHPPVVSAYHQHATNDVAQARGDYAFPNVQASAEPGSSDENADGYEEHIGNDVVKASSNLRARLVSIRCRRGRRADNARITYETENWEPHCNNLGGEVLSLHGKESGETHEPVASDTAEEDLVPLRSDLL